MTVRERFKSLIRRVRETLAPSEVAWRGAVTGVWVLTALLTLGMLVGDVMPDFWWGKLTGFMVGVGVLLLAGLLIRLLLALLALLSFRYRAHLFLLLPLLGLQLASLTGPKGIGLALPALLLIAATLGGGIAVLKRDGLRPRAQKPTLAGLAVGLSLLALGATCVLREGEPPNPWLAEYQLEDRTLDRPNPGERGTNTVETTTYGSGKDQRRPEYGESVGMVARSVDGSKLLDWKGPSGWMRTRYWGFDATEMPLQGRVWYPSGPGPFPLVLVVHGNHGMEDFSDPGYGYLGELMASRGMIFVSVDENFLNSSLADVADVIDPGLGKENDARGWLLLEHLAQWRDWNADPEHPFGGKVDMSRVALIGHSRGGEAVAVAAAFNRLDRYPDDATLAFDYGFDIRGVIAIAPIDGQYEPRGRGTPLQDVDYFVIHGSKDGDVSSFAGASQYSRIELTHDPTGERFHFKSSLYVLGANHGQFNTSWGRNDMGGLSGLMLDTRSIMPPEDQRRIAEVYFGAFLEIVLHDDRAYLPVFEDTRRAARWIPDGFYLNGYADSRQTWLATFEEDLDPTTTTLPGGRVEAEHLTRWREKWIELKWKPLDSHVAVLAWDERADPETPYFSLTLPPGAVPATPGARLVLSLSASARSTLPDDWEDDPANDDHEEPKSDDDEGPKPLDWTIVLVDGKGERAALPLSHERPLYPRIQAPTRRASLLEIHDTSEPVFHRHAYVLADFHAVNPALDVSSIAQIRFVFDKSPAGAILIDDIALAPE